MVNTKKDQYSGIFHHEISSSVQLIWHLSLLYVYIYILRLYHSSHDVSSPPLIQGNSYIPIIPHRSFRCTILLEVLWIFTASLHFVAIGPCVPCQKRWSLNASPRHAVMHVASRLTRGIKSNGSNGLVGWSYDMFLVARLSLLKVYL